MRFASLCFALALLSCSRDHLVATDGELHVSPDPVDFGTAWVGFPAGASAMLTYASSASCDVSVSATAPFTLDASSLHLASAARITVSVTPTAAGLISGTLTATGCGHTLSAPLRATAIEPPSCEGATSCTTLHFSPDAGGCVSAPLPDGTACSDACLTGATCQGGRCAGGAVDCDDLDPCTLDTCSATSGCQHLPGTSFCPPLAGCAQSCDGGDCGTLAELWSVSSRAGWIAQPIAADDQGNLFWLENTGSTQGAVVSYTHDGRLRFRQPFGLINADPRPMVVGDLFTFSYGLGDRIEAFSTADGTLRWERHLRDDLVAAGHPELAGAFSYVDHGTVGAQGELVYPIAFPSVGTGESFFIALDPVTGTTLWRASFGYGFWAIQGDERGDLFVQVTGDYSDGYHLASYQPDGGFLWRSTEFPGPTALGEVFTGTEALAASSGATDYRFAGSNGYPPGLVLPGLGVRLDGTGDQLELFDPADGHAISTFADPDVDWWNLLGATGGEVLGLDYQHSRLTALRSDGSLEFTCHLPPQLTGTQAQTGGAPLLLPGLLLTFSTSDDGDGGQSSALHAYALPGRDVAPRGWVSEGGSMSRTNRPR